ncbi:hypothetical protein RHMOL_Rhmol10G0294900 [Rhododendron molle]|uniref:Uncharacterized protein n=1 Tax=Rhododendron molle TaxID=49168 RepID=A0ACC0M8J9_RHOML|nr:hypothetical protein RHMOL_Rhmol10G0294900 [Rhododendron molle]
MVVGSTIQRRHKSNLFRVLPEIGHLLIGRNSSSERLDFTTNAHEYPSIHLQLHPLG